MTTTHRYQTHLVWDGSTGTGYPQYSRNHRVVTPPSTDEVAMSADPAFRGDPALHNPEQLLLAAASSCQLLSFLALAAQAGVDVVHYEDDAEAVMPASAEPVRITEVVLRPQVLVAPGTDLSQVASLVASAHDGCYIANTLTAEVVVQPSIEHAHENRVTRA